MIGIKKYYEVIAKCGHVGRRFYVPIKFAIIAESGKEAAKIVRLFPRVKHDHKDAILKVSKIDSERYLEIKQINENDAYLYCHSRKEQNINVDLSERLVIDNHYKKVKYDKQARKDRVNYISKKNRILEKQSWEDSDYDYAY